MPDHQMLAWYEQETAGAKGERRSLCKETAMIRDSAVDFHKLWLVEGQGYTKAHFDRKRIGTATQARPRGQNLKMTHESREPLAPWLQLLRAGFSVRQCFPETGGKSASIVGFQAYAFKDA